MNKFFGEFKTFIAKGNVMDLAVGMIIGSTFTKIVTSVVNDILNPLVSLMTGKTNFSDMFIALDGNHYATLEEARAAEATVLAYGNVIQVVIDFLITALCVFLIVRAVNRLREAGEKTRKRLIPGKDEAETAEKK